MTMRAFLTGKNVELMGHSPYSPDLTPYDFFLFQHISKKCVVYDFHRQKLLLKRSKPCFGDVSIGVDEQSQMMLVRQKMLSTIMLKNDKLSNGNVRLQLTTPEICQASNSLNKSRKRIL